MSTISDVARYAGVSSGTVSRVINAASNVTPEIRARVEHAIVELNYVPSMAARSLRSKRTSSLALVVPSVTNLFWRNLTRGVEDAAQGYGYAVLLCNHDDSLAKQQRYLAVASGQGVAGVIIAPRNPDAGDLAPLRDRATPTVLINRRINGWDVDGVYSDSVSASRALTRHLIDLGHRRIALLSGPPHLSTVQERIAGYYVALDEAGIPVDPRLIWSGEFRATFGVRLTEQLLSEGLNPTAIVAANNEIALGVITTLARRGQRVPHDVALACFGDSEETYFPFLTCIIEPAYEMGTHAAQLLFSRLQQVQEMPAKEVVLPTRLVIRYSCGSHLQPDGADSPYLVVPPEIPVATVLVRPFTPVERAGLSSRLADLSVPMDRIEELLLQRAAPNVARLVDALSGRSPDRVPHFESRFENLALYEHVLERKCSLDTSALMGEPATIPEDDVELARRLGMDAATCHFAWPLAAGSIRGWADLDRLRPPPSLADQFARLARYLDAARGTGVGIVAGFASPFGVALAATGLDGTQDLLGPQRRLIETAMDILQERATRDMRAVCDRFAPDLALVYVRDAVPLGLSAGPLADLYLARLRWLIAPAKEHGKLVALDPGGPALDLLPALYAAGVNAIHIGDVPLADLVELKRRWAGRLALLGGFPQSVLRSGDRTQIGEMVQEMCLALAPRGGYVLGAAGPVTGDVSPESYLALVQAVHRYG